MATGNHRAERYIRYALIVFGVLFLVLFVFLLAQYLFLRRHYLFDARQFHIPELLERHAPIPVSDAGLIHSWMTFDYINKLFALPPDYLKTKIPITDPYYPRTTISSYAKMENVDAAAMVTQVENAVRVYVAPNNSTTTSPGAASTSASI